MPSIKYYRIQTVFDKSTYLFFCSADFIKKRITPAISRRAHNNASDESRA
jgi:hypothetical protein